MELKECPADWKSCRAQRINPESRMPERKVEQEEA